MKLKLRPGIVKTQVCGVYLLYPTRAASSDCPYIQKIGLIGSVLISEIEKSGCCDKVYEIYRMLGHKTAEEAKQKIDAIVDDLYNKGFLIPVEDEE